MTTLQPVRGTQSLLGEDADRIAAVVAAFDRVRRLFGFKRVEVPVIEPTAVFARSIGETTDVVSKEMYTFEDRGGEFDHAAARIHRRHLPRLSDRRLAAARAAEGRDPRPGVPLRAPAKGPLPPVPPARRRDHRRRRAAGGRRGCSPSPTSCSRELGHRRRRRRSSSTRSAIRRRATPGATRCIEHFAAHATALSEDSRARLERNPLRILDSKAHQDWPIVDSAPAIDDFLTAEAADFFAAVTAGLDAAGIAWERAPRLVRGLDYYRHTAFEFVTDQLGRARHGARRRALRRADRNARRPAHAGGRLGGRDRAAGDDDRRARAPSARRRAGAARRARGGRGAAHPRPSFAAPASPPTWPIAAI